MNLIVLPSDRCRDKRKTWGQVGGWNDHLLWQKGVISGKFLREEFLSRVSKDKEGFPDGQGGLKSNSFLQPT